MSGDEKGNWHPLPNIRLKVILVTHAVDKHRDFAQELAIKSNLPEKYHKDFVNDYGLFYQSYEHLLESLEKPSGGGVSFQTDSIEVRKYWRDFLFNGRVMLDFVGLHSKEALGLTQKIGGLNKKKFALLLTFLEKQGATDKRFLGVKVKLEPLKTDVLRFIDFRDREKTSGNTIAEFPVIDSEYGIVEGGKISLNGVGFNMVEFVKSSYNSIYKLTLILLGI
ncbi:MAG: hypothetical protein UU57_C0038G0001 [Candidatus Woesebacteria bacterium GW2011_GWE1_41_24]|nr:MAG: hypothetical protein UU57_C0038G0001 [Candidatus Woesebacteria bacterium GW2011_GWE1_41_24]